MIMFPWKTGGRDRTAARATLGGEFPTLALSMCEVGASFHHGPRFRRPPCDPGRWDFPSPVLALVCPCGRLPGLGEAQVLPHIHPSPWRLTSQGVPLFPGPTCPATPGTTRCPEPLCTIEVLPLSSRSSWTTSAGVTPPSSLVRAHAPILHPLAASV
jgi:hypothetical protein